MANAVLNRAQSSVFLKSTRELAIKGRNYLRVAGVAQMAIEIAIING